jgi:hypothetical protein
MGCSVRFAGNPGRTKKPRIERLTGQHCAARGKSQENPPGWVGRAAGLAGLVYWKTHSPERTIGACQNLLVIDPVNAALFMTAANISKKRARSAALNAWCAARRSRIGTPSGFPDINSLPVQPRRPMTDHCPRRTECQTLMRRWAELTAARVAQVAPPFVLDGERMK